jgi:hypothetical protein
MQQPAFSKYNNDVSTNHIHVKLGKLYIYIYIYIYITSLTLIYSNTYYIKQQVYLSDFNKILATTLLYESITQNFILK